MNNTDIKLMIVLVILGWVLYAWGVGDWLQAIFAYLIFRDVAETLP